MGRRIECWKLYLLLWNDCPFPSQRTLKEYSLEKGRKYEAGTYGNLGTMLKLRHWLKVSILNSRSETPFALSASRSLTALYPSVGSCFSEGPDSSRMYCNGACDQGPEEIALVSPSCSRDWVQAMGAPGRHTSPLCFFTMKCGVWWDQKDQTKPEEINGRSRNNRDNKRNFSKKSINTFKKLRVY